MSDLLDHTRKYISCEDPVESAARQQRVHEGEERDLMKETAISIIRSTEINLAAHNNQSQQAMEPIKTNDPTFGSAFDALVGPRRESPVRKGKSHSKKKDGFRPKLLPGSCSRKRNASVHLAHNSPRGQRITSQRADSSSNRSTNVINQTVEPSTPLRGTNRHEDITNQNPTIRVILARKKAKSGYFRTDLNPLP